MDTMNLKKVQTLLNSMHIKGNVIVVNQVTESETGKPSKLEVKDCTLLNYHERGLSRSRNRALDASNGDICVIADDDMYYEEDYEKVINAAYAEFPIADVIAFHVDSNDPRQRKKILKKGRLNRITSMKIASWQSITPQSMKMEMVHVMTMPIRDWLRIQHPTQMEHRC